MRQPALSWTSLVAHGLTSPTGHVVAGSLVLSWPHTINLYNGFVCHDDVVVVAVTSDYQLERSD